MNFIWLVLCCWTLSKVTRFYESQGTHIAAGFRVSYPPWIWATDMPPAMGILWKHPKKFVKAKKLGSCIYRTSCEFYLAVRWDGAAARRGRWLGGAGIVAANTLQPGPLRSPGTRPEVPR